MDITDEYWKQYLPFKEQADAEDASNPNPPVAYRQYLPTDPSHPRAFIPNYVRYAKRQAAGFRCPITGWHETDYFQDISGTGPVRLVGRLTIDHKLPGALGGLTTDENIQVMSEFANCKKGSLAITNEDLTTKILATHKRVILPGDLYHHLKLYNITKFYGAKF